MKTSLKNQEGVQFIASHSIPLQNKASKPLTATRNAWGINPLEQWYARPPVAAAMQKLPLPCQNGSALPHR